MKIDTTDIKKNKNGANYCIVKMIRSIIISKMAFPAEPEFIVNDSRIIMEKTIMTIKMTNFPPLFYK